MTFNPGLIINDTDSQKGGFDKSGNFYAQNIISGGRFTQNVQSAKVGGTAGWVVAGTTNLPLVTLPASQTGSTLVIPIDGLKVGDTIKGFNLIGQIESAGGAVTLDAALRKITNAAAGFTDALVSAITQVAVTADTALVLANAGKSDLTEVVGIDETFYILVTATTAASTDVEIQGVTVITNWSA
jgi:hypothetical protein